MFFGFLFGLAVAYIIYKYFKMDDKGKMGGSKGTW